MSVPEWVPDAIFYQIFPDRFYNGEPANDPANVQPWNSPPTRWNFLGGDLRGIIYKLDYLLDLGINAIYLNPIFQSASNHGYHVTDYFRVDPRFGDLKDFRNLIKEAHSNKVRIILDGVFNHCGRGFFAFNDILENQEHSPYTGWFHITHFPVSAYGGGKARDYLAWWGHKALPKFNTGNPAVRHYILEVAKYWIDQGSDGWRLDVPNEIDDDEFWAEFRQVIKSTNPQAYLLGEIWEADPRWVNETHFDGLMNYPLRTALLGLLDDKLSITTFVKQIEKLFNIFPPEHVFASYLLLGSHDTERLFTRLNEDISKVKLAFLLLFSFPGAPAIYYGDEIAMTGGKDPECRAGFAWEKHQHSNELHTWMKSLVAVRNNRPALRRGYYRRVFCDNAKRIFAFGREYETETILVVVNASSQRQQISIDTTMLDWRGRTYLSNLLNNERYTLFDGNLPVSIPPWSGIMIG